MPSQYRYPGPISFSRDQHHLFIGREDEANQVCRLLMSSRILAMHGSSGSGKSSLIQAGIIPEMEELSKKLKREIFLIDINFQSIVPPINQFKRALPNEDAPVPFQRIMISEWSMWYALKQFLYTRQNVIPLIILDQFEQLFAQDKQVINAFIQQLAEVNFGHMPREFADDLAISRILDKSLQEALEDGLEDYLKRPLECMLLISTRSDRLRHIHKLQELMPDITRNTFELKGLRKEDARKAIEVPAQLDGEFQSRKKFRYDENLLGTLIDSLTAEEDAGAVMELIDLQIICSHIERDVAIKQKKTVITEQDIPALSDIRKEWYQEILKRFNDKHRRLAQQLVEGKLIGDNPPRRISVEELELKPFKSVLRSLTSSGLLRREEFKTGGFYYFISHDRLVEPIINSKRERLAVDQHTSGRANRREQLRRMRELRSEAVDFKKKGNLMKAKVKYEEALVLLKDLPDADRPRWDILFQLGKIALSEKNHDHALQYCNQALSIAKKADDPVGIARSYEQLGSINLIMAYELSYRTPVAGRQRSDRVSKETKEALKYYRKAAKAYQNAGESIHYARLHEEIADNFEHLKFKERLDLYQTAKEHYQELGEPIHAAKINPKYDKLKLEAENVQRSGSDTLIRELLDLTLTRFKEPQTWGYLTDLLTGQVHPLKKGTIHVGRSTDQISNDINIRAQSVSRNHLSIQNDLSIQEKRSLNGTSVNGSALYFSQRPTLADGDLIILASHYPLLFTVGQPDPPEIPPETWGMIVSTGIKENYTFLSEPTYAIGFESLAVENGHTGFQLLLHNSEDRELPMRLRRGRALAGTEMFFDDKTLGPGWQVMFTLIKPPDFEKQTDYQYKQYVLTPGTWGPSVNVPLIFVKMIDREIAGGPVPFQFIPLNHNPIV